MTKLRGKYRKANRASGKPAVKSNESSTREDREWLDVFGMDQQKLQNSSIY
jgi:hypothetical protein